MQLVCSVDVGQLEMVQQRMKSPSSEKTSDLKKKKVPHFIPLVCSGLSLPSPHNVIHQPALRCFSYSAVSRQQIHMSPSRPAQRLSPSTHPQCNHAASCDLLLKVRRKISCFLNQEKSKRVVRLRDNRKKNTWTLFWTSDEVDSVKNKWILF